MSKRIRATTALILFTIATLAWNFTPWFVVCAMIIAFGVGGLVEWYALARRARWHSIAYLVGLFLVAAIALACIFGVLHDGLLPWLVLVTAAHDSGGYIGGSIWGSTPLAKRISPKKTVEGLYAGVILAALAGGALSGNSLPGALIGACVGIIATAGDLAESMLKRKARVKHSGSLLPGHGGILDRIDGLTWVLTAALFVGPAQLTLWLWG